MVSSMSTIHSQFCADATIHRIRKFLDQEALPLWSSRGVYENGCFVERFDLVGNPEDPGFTRTRVQARQLFVYCHAEWNKLYSAPKVRARATDFFLRSAWGGAEKGWSRNIDRNGEIIDSSLDLYDISFALFALSWVFRVDPNQRYLDIAIQTIDLLRKKMAHPLGGYFNDENKSSPRQQNPHMHLLEAMMSWLAATGDSTFSAVGNDLVDLFESKFFDRDTSTLGEYFSEEWRPVSGEKGRIVEPGHQFEWAWILANYGPLVENNLTKSVSMLTNSGWAHGFNEQSSLTIDQVDRIGTPLAESIRLWPQTEALKALVAEFEYLGVRRGDRVDRIVEAIFSHFIDTAPLPGTWIDHFNADGSIKSTNIPATSLYHIYLAFSEILRVHQSTTINEDSARLGGDNVELLSEGGLTPRDKHERLVRTLQALDGANHRVMNLTRRLTEISREVRALRSTLSDQGAAVHENVV